MSAILSVSYCICKDTSLKSVRLIEVRAINKKLLAGTHGKGDRLIQVNFTVRKKKLVFGTFKTNKVTS